MCACSSRSLVGCATRQDDDERERLSELAQSYINLSVESCESERKGRTSCLDADVRAYFADGASPPQRQIDGAEFEAIRTRCAVTSAAELQQPTYPELQNLADSSRVGLRTLGSIPFRSRDCLGWQMAYAI
jgi:hypothetical protein